MIARMVNCTGERDTTTYAPCNECASCRLTDHPDVLEINAADARGIDDVRSLVQQAKNMPTIGNKRIYIVDEAHQLTAQASQVLLKPLEEPPASTLWIICTMSPDKVLPAIAKRCLSLAVKPVEPELLVKRLYTIAKREGVDFKTIEDGGKVLKTIADFANGGVRASIQLLESVLYAYQGDDKIDANTVLTKYLSGGEADLDKAAANVLFAVMSPNLKGLVKAVPSDNVRGVLNKMRWLLDYLVNNSVGAAKFVPYSGRAFAALTKSSDMKIQLATLLMVQNLLLEIEWRFNTQSVDERVVFTAMLGNFIAQEMRRAS
jgi:DNA polymerase III subunit gamma/tau